MVLEYLVGLKEAEHRPWEMFFIGLLYSSVALLLSLWIFKGHFGLNVVFLTTIASMPLIINAINREKQQDMDMNDERSRLRSHSKVVSLFIFLFLGITLGFSLWYVFLPAPLAEDVFSMQIATITSVDQQVVAGRAISDIKGISPSVAFSNIFQRNIKLLFFCLLFSFFYGAGAIYILALNASFIGTAIGIFVTQAGNYATGYPLALLRYLTHGIPEIMAFFIAGLAGGIISIAIIKHDFKSKYFERVVFDSLDLVLLSVVYLVVATLIEVYVTPAFF